MAYSTSMEKPIQSTSRPKGPSVFDILGGYRKMILVLLGVTLIGNTLTLVIPKMIAQSIDAFAAGNFVMKTMIVNFTLISIGIFIFLYIQSVLQTYASEKVARDLRRKLSQKLSLQNYAYIQNKEPAKLLTNLTSDIDAIKLFVSQAIVSLVSSFAVIVGASILVLSLNWRLGLVVLTIIPIIGVVFYLIFSKIRALFMTRRNIVDNLNKVINESILGAAFIRVVHGEEAESKKFYVVNTNAKNTGLAILNMFALLIPAITFISGLGSIAIVLLGGHFVITGTMSLGALTAFYTYLAMLIFPILIIGFMTNIIADASASYTRIHDVLMSVVEKQVGGITSRISGAIEVQAVSMIYNNTPALDNISFSIAPKTRTAIVGPIAAGKSQLLYMLSGLLEPSSGSVLYDGIAISAYEQAYFHNTVGLVFQESVIFNTTIRENIAFNTTGTKESFEKAVATAELAEFVHALPDGFETIVSERGSNLSGGQKQRIMLARALATNPRVLLLDDFTARVDFDTERRILENIATNYPELTLVSVTQKISSVIDYDNIIVIMEGEMIAMGAHAELLETNLEYAQLYDAQKSTQQYELHT